MPTISETIAQKVKENKPLTINQKIKILKDARKSLLDPSKWTQGEWLQIVDETGQRSGTQNNWAYIPSKNESVSMCVMGAVARAAGSDATYSGIAMKSMAACSLGKVMLEALPPQAQIGYENVREIYEDEYPSVALGRSFDEYLHDNKMDYLDYYVSSQEEDALDFVYDYNDNKERQHVEIIALLDTAIANLEKKKLEKNV